MRQLPKNLAEIDGDIVTLLLEDDKKVLLDLDDWNRLNIHRWFVRKSFSRPYCMRKYRNAHGEFYIRMHREVMRTPRNEIVHHKNRNTLDNRKSNLENMLQKHHHHIHTKTYPRLIKYADENVTETIPDHTHNS